VFNLSGSETVFLLLLALIVLGPEKLPDALRRFGKGYAEFRKMATGFQTEMRSALDEPMREMRETADAIKQAANLEGLDELVSDAKKGFRFDSAAPAPTHAKVAPPSPGDADAGATDSTTTDTGDAPAAGSDDDALIAALDADPGVDLSGDGAAQEERPS
jgi:sec-independent protein translocase protein TatB